MKIAQNVLQYVLCENSTWRAEMDVRVGDVLTMKKKHPCGGNKFLVLRSGMDFRIRCMGCGREVMVSRAKCEKNIKTILHDENGAI